MLVSVLAANHFRRYMLLGTVETHQNKPTLLLNSLTH